MTLDERRRVDARGRGDDARPLPLDVLGEVATEFHRVHNIQRAVDVGSVDAVIRAAELRPRIIDAIESRLR